MTRTPYLVLLMGLCALAASSNANPPAVVVPKTVVDYRPLGAGDGLSPAKVERIIELLESIDANTRAPAAAGEAAEPDVATVIRTKCASCHRPAVKKGRIALVATDDGSVPNVLTEEAVAKVKQAVDTGHMPPPEAKALTPAEKKSFRKLK